VSKYAQAEIDRLVDERDQAREENRVLSRALTLACKDHRDTSAMKDALIQQAGVDLEQIDYMRKVRREQTGDTR
jgi:hypothetical protein